MHHMALQFIEFHLADFRPSLQFAKFISNSGLIQQGICNSSQLGVICVFYKLFCILSPSLLMKTLNGTDFLNKFSNWNTGCGIQSRGSCAQPIALVCTKTYPLERHTIHI